MKPLPTLLVLIASLGTGLAGGYLGSRLATPAPSATPELAPTTSSSSMTQEQELALRGELGSLQQRMEALHEQVASLRSASERVAALPEKLEVAPELDSANAIAALNKNAIKAVIEEDRAEQARKREEERKQRQSEQLENRAEAVAKKVGLDALQTKQLTAFYEQEQARMEEFRSQMRDGDVPADREAMRQTFQDFRTWREDELNKTFGNDTAAKILENDRFGGFGGGPGGMGGQGGQGGRRRGGQGAQGGAADPQAGGNGG